jgi:hypothetical protein
MISEARLFGLRRPLCVGGAFCHPIKQQKRRQRKDAAAVQVCALITQA